MTEPEDPPTPRPAEVGGSRDQEPTVRPTGRVLLLDGRDRILLFCSADPGAPERGPFWHTPGGGLKPGESFEEAALRELREETGIEDVCLGPCVWTRRHVYSWRGRQHEWRSRYFLTRVADLNVDVRNMEKGEREALRGHRWWSLSEIEASSQTFSPPRLAELLRPLLAGDLPAEPIDVGP